MILGLEIAMLVMGFIALITGKMKLAKGKVATGLPARLAGLVFLLPLPLSFAAGFTLAFLRALANQPTNPKDMWLTMVLLEGGIALGCLIAGLAIAAYAGRPPSEKPPPRVDDLPEAEPVAHAERVTDSPPPVRRRIRLPADDPPRRRGVRLEDDAPRRGVPTAVIVAGVFALVGLGLGVVLLGLAFALWFPTNSPPAARVAPPAVPMANPPAPVAQPARVQEWKEPPGAPQEVKPLAPEPKKVEPPPPPPRPRFGDEHAYRESLAKGRVYMEVWIRDADPADRDGQTPARIVLVDLEAPRGYLAELTWSAAFNLDRHRIPGLRLENLRGEELAVGSQPPDKGRVIKLFYQPAKTEPHRFVVTVEPDAVHVPFTFTVRAATHADILPEVSRTKPRALPACPPIRLVGKAGPYLTGALSPDGKTAWFVDVNRGLYCRGLPDLADRGTYKIDSHPYQFVFVKADRLYALCEHDLAPLSVNTDRPDHERGIATLRLYDPSSPPAKGQLLLTRESVSLGANPKVGRLLLSQDGKFYYYLDTAGNAVHKRTTEAYMFIKAPADKIKKGTTALALSPDGKMLYTCGSGNFIEQIDAETMQIKKTIRLTHGKPTALVATDSGYLFLKPSSPGDEKSILLVNANPDYGDKEVFPLMWSSHSGPPSSFLLSRDQRWLYVHESGGGQPRLGAYHVADWPGIDRGQLAGELRDGSLNTQGRLALSRDGNYLLIDKGLLLSVGP